jgi:AraC family transcriptional regulator
VAQLGKQFEQIKVQIPNRQQPWVFAAVSKDFDKQAQTFWYMMGDVVTHIGAIPVGLETFDIPAGTYAVFPVRPKNKFGWGFAIGNTKRFAYEEWLPQSGYKPAGSIDDFEYHDARSERPKNPEIDLYVAIKPKR